MRIFSLAMIASMSVVACESEVPTADKTSALSGSGTGGGGYGSPIEFVPIGSTGYAILDGQLCAEFNSTFDTCSECCEEAAVEAGEPPLGGYYDLCTDECEDPPDDGMDETGRINDFILKFFNGAIAAYSFRLLMKAHGLTTALKCQEASSKACATLAQTKVKQCLEVTYAACLALPPN